MNYRALGRTGVQVSRLCFGTMPFGGDANETDSAQMYRAGRDAGINFFDTADQYSKGRSEEILGGLMRGHRDELIIATKCYSPSGSDINARGGSRRHIRRALEASLKRLQTDRVEILYLHQYDALTPLEESMRAQERHGWARLQVIQPMYNLVKRQAEVEILPMAQANGLAVVPYSPAGGGLLSGKYARQDTATGRLATNKMYESRYGEQWMHEVAAKFAAFAGKRGVHPMSLALAWVASHPAVTAPIIGARNLDQLRPSLESVNVDVTPELRAEIAALSRTPPPATDRLEEQRG